jgi:acyl-CoA synthetase (NDP forming)
MDEVAAAVRRASTTRPDKPVVGIFMTYKGAPSEMAPIPCFRFPEAAAVALARAAEYGAWRRQPPGTVPVFDDIDQARIRLGIERTIARGGGWMTPDETRALLEAAGIGVPAQVIANSETDAVRAAAQIGYPVVLKAVGGRIVHKTNSARYESISQTRRPSARRGAT